MATFCEEEDPLVVAGLPVTADDDDTEFVLRAGMAND